MRNRTTTILFIIILFLANGILFAQTDSLSLRLKNVEKSKSLNLGVGIFREKELRDEGLVGLYLTGSYFSKISKNFSLGAGVDVYDNSTKYIKYFTIGLFLNPIFRFNILKNKISFGLGGQMAAILRFSKEDENSLGGAIWFNIRVQYNITKTFSIGLEYKTLTFYPFLSNVYISYNF